MQLSQWLLRNSLCHLRLHQQLKEERLRSHQFKLLLQFLSTQWARWSTFQLNTLSNT